MKANERFQTIYVNEGSNGGYPSHDEQLPDAPWKCPLCGDCFDEFGNLIEDPSDWEPMKEECDNCKASELFEELLAEDVESLTYLYNFKKDNGELPKFWVYMAEKLDTQIHIAQIIMTEIIELNEERKRREVKPVYHGSPLWDLLNETFCIDGQDHIR